MLIILMYGFVGDLSGITHFIHCSSKMLCVFSITAHAFYENKAAEAGSSTRTHSLVCLISSRVGLLLAAILATHHPPPSPTPPCTPLYSPTPPSGACRTSEWYRKRRATAEQSVCLK